MSNSLDPDQTRHSVGPDFGPNCLERLSADNTSRQRVKVSQSDHKGPVSSGSKLFHVLKLFVIMKNSADPVEMSHK